MDTNKKPVWFPAKRYGWGWGAPCTWQGWVVLAVWLVLLGGAAFLFLPRHQALWMVSLAVLTTALIVVCLIKGEKPRWRWGDRGCPPKRPLADRLAELDDLRKKQLLSESEYNAMRQKILSASESGADS
jgi:hypothetical protein